jgi:hypothetical protein
MEKDDLVRECYEGQMSNMRFGSSENKLKGELDQVGLASNWQNPQEHSMNKTC